MTRTPEEWDAYYKVLEKRCKYFEETITSTVNFLQVIIQDFDTPVLGPIIERLNSLIVFLEATSDNAPNPNKDYSVEE